MRLLGIRHKIRIFADRSFYLHRMDHRRMAVAHCCNASNAEPKLNNFCVTIINCYFSFEQILSQIQCIFSEKTWYNTFLQSDSYENCENCNHKQFTTCHVFGEIQTRNVLIQLNKTEVKWYKFSTKTSLNSTADKLLLNWTIWQMFCWAEAYFFLLSFDNVRQKKIGKRKVPRSSVQHINSKHLSV